MHSHGTAPLNRAARHNRAASRSCPLLSASALAPTGEVIGEPDIGDNGWCTTCSRREINSVDVMPAVVADDGTNNRDEGTNNRDDGKNDRCRNPWRRWQRVPIKSDSFDRRLPFCTPTSAHLHGEARVQIGPHERRAAPTDTAGSARAC